MYKETERMENEILNCIFARSSIRAYTDEKLTDDEISTLADVALAAPTAMNAQTQRFFFITDKEIIADWENAVADEIAKSGPEPMKERMRERKGRVFYNAPLFVAVAIDKNGHFTMCDSGIAVSHLALAAKSMGLDSVILGLPDLAFQGERGESIRKRIGIPEELDFAIGIAIGHAAMDKAPHDSDNSHVIYVND